MLTKSFGQRLRLLREQRGLTQRDLAERINTQIAQISRYENGLYLPGPETLIEISSILHTSLDQLLLGKESQQGTSAAPVRNLLLLERLSDLDQLPREDQEVVVRLIDAVIKSRQVERVITSRQTPGQTESGLR